MTTVHTLFGTWEIVTCTYDGKIEISGLEGIKFRLDDSGDITWYNDLVSPIAESKDCDSANVLFSCETFDINEYNPRLTFSAFAGHSIEFNTNTLTPTGSIVLNCENWYMLECRRVKQNEAAGQEKQFTLYDALTDSYFWDVNIKSSCGKEFHVHSPILRLNGFDCSMYTHPDGMMSAITSLPTLTKSACSKNATMEISPVVKIDITPMLSQVQIESNSACREFSSVYLQPPTDNYALEDDGNNKRLGYHRNHQLSSSYNCLPTKSENSRHHPESLLSKFEHNSHSDSHLETSLQCKNIFNFCQDLLTHHSELTTNSLTTCNTRHPPLSPYRARSPSPFTSALDTPPSSPLTPVGVLHNLPSFLLQPIFHWLYTESLMVNMTEEVCEKLINFLETQPSLTKMIDPTKTYLNLLRLKKFVVNIIRESHDIFNGMLQSINSSSISREPFALYSTYKNCFRECAVVCIKIVQICNIFIKKRTKTSRYQKNEIIKYIRTQIPEFLAQIHKLLQNTLEIFTSLSEQEKKKLVHYLLPEIETTLSVLSNVCTEIKKSFEKICKDMKSTHMQFSMKEDNNGVDHESIMLAIDSDNFISTKFDKPLENLSKNVPADNDLKFVMHMYEVRKIREIYDRISTILDIINDKKKAYCEMDYLSKQSTILQNFDYLIMEMPMYILILENIMNRLEEKMGWKEFKFCFKLVTSQINGVIVKVFEHKSALSDPIKEINKLVHKKEFMQALVDLGLLESSNDLENEDKTIKKNDLHLDATYKNIKLDLTRHLCESPVTAISYLSKNSLRLLHSGQLADMEFEVQTFQVPASYLPATPLQHNEKLQAQSPIQAHTFKAHRVIVAARCEWFKKALLSGMKESIKRKIIITDTSPVIFRRLLLYLYGAPIDKSVGAEEICELMLLADRYYIDDLKELCESTLNALVDEESVICLLVIADRYLATALRRTCLSFLSQHAELRKSDMFKELPKVLQIEVMDLINWYGRVPEPWNDGLRPRNSSRHSLKSPSKSRGRSRKSSPSQG